VRPIPVPEPLRSQLAEAGAQFQVWAAPNGDLTDPEVRPIEAFSYLAAVRGEGDSIRDGQPVTSVIIQLEEGDLELLQDTGLIEFGVWGGALPVFFLSPLRTVSEEEWREYLDGTGEEKGDVGSDG
jgi:hypothetical protein